MVFEGKYFGKKHISMSREAMAAIFRNEFERLSSYEFFHQAGLRPSDFFYSNQDIDTFWSRDGFTNPAGSWLMAYSKKSWAYPAFAMEAILPTLGAAELIGAFGFEEGGRGLTGLAKLAVWQARFVLLTLRQGGLVNLVNITNFLPIDYDSVRHRYGIKLNKCNVEAYIDEKIVGLTLFGLPEPLPVWQDNNPYSLNSSDISLMAMRVLIDMVFEPLPPYPSFTIVNRWGVDQFICNDGDPLPPRQYALYNENTATKWNGLATGVVVTSHPVPIWGYPKKTLHIQSNAAGTVVIQVYVGGAWRTYDSIVLVANTLRVYPITTEAPILRCVYTPVGADTIAVGEFYLS